MAYDNSISYTYPIHTHQVIQSISYSVSFGGCDLSEVYKNIAITFKTEYCPSLNELQTAFGEKLMASEWSGSPSLQTGQGVRFSDYHILSKKHLVFIKNNGCEFSVLGRADEFK